MYCHLADFEAFPIAVNALLSNVLFPIVGFKDGANKKRTNRNTDPPYLVEQTEKMSNLLKIDLFLCLVNTISILLLKTSTKH